MVILKCDLCGNTQGNIYSMILYKQKIDYCGACIKKAAELRKDLRKEIEDLKELQNKRFDSTLRRKERLLIKNYKE